MKTTLAAFLAAGVALAMPATLMLSSAAYAGGYGYNSGGSYAPKVYHPKYYYKKHYTPPPVYAYNGDYPPASCYGENTYEPPSGYSDGCTPPPEWIQYCHSKYGSFDEDNGYYLGYDQYYHYCK